MEFEWKLEDNQLVLYGYGTEKIATLEYNDYYNIWELESKWLDHTSELDKMDVKSAKIEAVDELKRACEEHMDWYKGQIEMLNELLEDK